MDITKDAVDNLDGKTHEYIDFERITDKTALIIWVPLKNFEFFWRRCNSLEKLVVQGKLDEKSPEEDAHWKDGSIRLKRFLIEDWNN